MIFTGLHEISDFFFIVIDFVCVQPLIFYAGECNEVHG